jgi:hypothetical protein
LTRSKASRRKSFLGPPDKVCIALKDLIFKHYDRNGQLAYMSSQKLETSSSQKSKRSNPNPKTAACLMRQSSHRCAQGHFKDALKMKLTGSLLTCWTIHSTCIHTGGCSTCAQPQKASSASGLCLRSSVSQPPFPGWCSFYTRRLFQIDMLV